jgi:hypothetical protein
MKKTLIYIPETAHRRLRYKAIDDGTSMATLIRKAVDAYLKRESKKERRR